MCSHSPRARRSHPPLRTLTLNVGRATIACWLQSERNDPSFKRNSVCDCQNVDGLMTAYECVDGKQGELDVPLFKMLGMLGAKEKTVNSRPQRLAVEKDGVEVWVQPSGTLVCAHGNTRRAIAKMKKGGSNFKRRCTILCECSLAFPRRRGTIFAPKQKKKADEDEKDETDTSDDEEGGSASPVQ